MGTYFVYGKRTDPEHMEKGHLVPQDKQFKAIDSLGRRVAKLEQAIPFTSREEAKKWLDEKIAKWGTKQGVKFEIRKKN